MAGVLKTVSGKKIRLGSNLFQNFENEINEEEGVEKGGQRRWGLMLL